MTASNAASGSSVATNSTRRTAWTKVEVKPAAAVWDEPCPTDLAQQADFFRREGFLILRAVLSQQDLTQLHEELARLVRDHASLPRVREGFDLEPVQDGSRAAPTFRKIGGIAELSPAFASLMRHPRIVEVMHALMGPRIELYRDVVMMKPARVGREKPWHQDSVYWPWRPMALVSAMTALDDAGPANGCLQVVPRSHHQEVQHYGQELQVEMDETMQARTRYAPLQAGDTLLFHSLLLHGSEPNTSAQDRRVCIFSCKPDNLTYIGKGEPAPPLVISDRRGA